MKIGIPRPAESVILGGVPRVHLLPKEVGLQRKAKTQQRYLLIALAGVVAVVIAGIGIATLRVASANADQATEQARTASLITEQGKYSSVTTVQNQVNDIESVQPVATHGEILWSDFVAKLQSTLPPGTSITAIVAKLDEASTSTATAADPLAGKHIATVTVTALGPQASISSWLGQLTSLKGVVSATPGNIAVSPKAGQYTANVDLLLSVDIASVRFASGKK